MFTLNFLLESFFSVFKSRRVQWITIVSVRSRWNLNHKRDIGRWKINISDVAKRSSTSSSCGARRHSKVTVETSEPEHTTEATCCLSLVYQKNGWSDFFLPFFVRVYIQSHWIISAPCVLTHLRHSLTFARTNNALAAAFRWHHTPRTWHSLSLYDLFLLLFPLSFFVLSRAARSRAFCQRSACSLSDMCSSRMAIKLCIKISIQLPHSPKHKS